MAITLASSTGFIGYRFVSALVGADAGTAYTVVSGPARIGSAGLVIDVMPSGVVEVVVRGGGVDTPFTLRGVSSLSERSVLLAALASGQTDAQVRSAFGGAASVAAGVSAVGLLKGSTVVTPTPTPTPTLTISGTPAAAVVGNSASFTPTISGGTGPYTLSVASGALPAGVTRSGNSLTGTYTTAGAFSYTLRATDAVNATADLPLSVTVTNAVVPVTISGTPGAATVGTAYTFTPTTANGSGTKAFALTGTLPAGLTFSTTTGAITGTPTTAATTPGLNIGVTDDTGSASLGAFSLVVSASANPTLTMTQFADKRTFQRATTAGGTNSKGAGTVPVAITIDQPATIEYRLRDAVASGNPTLQDWATAGSVTGGATSVTCPSVPARLGWYYVDIRLQGGTAILGSSRVGMGRVILVSGQSLAVRCFNIVSAPVVTFATLGVSVSANATTYVSANNDNGANLFSPAWLVPSDAGPPNSAFLPSLINLQEAAAGVNIAVIGHARGSTAIAQFVPGGTESARLRQVMTDVGGFEAFYWFQGHSDASIALIPVYASQLTKLFADVTSYNAVRGSNFERYMTTIPNITSTAWGGTFNDWWLRLTAAKWAKTNNTKMVLAEDLQLYDGVHPDQYGNVANSKHLHRSTRPAFGLAGDDTGPSITSASRPTAGTAITVNFALPTGATALTAIGDLSQRLQVYAPGTVATPLALDATTPYTVGTNTVTLNLATAAADGPLEINLDLPLAGDVSAWTNGLYDNHTDSDGITIGRQAVANPIPIVARGSKLGLDLTATGAVYGAGPSGFGQALTLNSGVTANGTGANVLPSGIVWTMECRFLAAANTSALRIMMGMNNRCWVGISVDGHLIASYRSAADVFVNGTDNTTSANPIVTDNVWHHVAMVADGTEVRLYLDGVLVGTNTAYIANTAGSSGFQIGAYNGASKYTGGGIQEVATRRDVKYTANFTPPTAPYTFADQSIYALWHLNGDGTAAASS